MKKLFSGGELLSILIPFVIFGFGVGGIFVMQHPEKYCTPVEKQCDQGQAKIYGQCSEIFPFCKEQCTETTKYSQYISGTCIDRCVELYKKPSSNN